MQVRIRGYNDGRLLVSKQKAKNATTAQTLLLLSLLIGTISLCEAAAVPNQTPDTRLVAEQATTGRSEADEKLLSRAYKLKLQQ